MSDNTNTQQKDAKEQGLVIDLANLANAPRGAKVKLDLDEDAWAIPAPPRHDIYTLKPVIAKNGVRYFKQGMKDNYGRVIEIPFYNINIEHRIIAESDLDSHMVPVFQYLSTKLGRGKKISTCAAFIKKLGFKVPEEIDDLGQVELLAQVLKAEKVLFGEIDWRGSFQDSDGTWQNTCNTAADFPKDSETGERMHRMRVTKKNGTPAEVNAQLTVAKLYSRKEYKEISESGELDKIRKSFGFGSDAVNVAQLAEEEEVAAPVVVKPNGVAKKQKPQEEPVTVSQGKMALALVEDDD